MEVSLIKPEDVEDIWGTVSPLVSKALAHNNNEMTIDDIKSALIKGDHLLLIVNDGPLIHMAMTLSIGVFPQKKVCLGTFAGGRGIDKWMDMVEGAVVKIAKSQGCSSIYVGGRRGWVKKLKPLGYNEISTLVAKEI